MNMSVHFRVFESKQSKEFQAIENDLWFKEHWTVNRKRMEDYLRKNNFISCICNNTEYWSTSQKNLDRFIKIERGIT